MRNNQKRLQGAATLQPQMAPSPVTAMYAVPTEFVELPSRGKFYPEGHALHGEDTIEIRYMTAKEEDILSSAALIEKGFVKLKNFTQSKAKANYLYELTPRGIREKTVLTVQFLERKRHEYNDLRDEIERLENEIAIEGKNLSKDNRG